MYYFYCITSHVVTVHLKSVKTIYFVVTFQLVAWCPDTFGSGSPVATETKWGLPGPRRLAWSAGPDKRKFRRERSFNPSAVFSPPTFCHLQTQFVSSKNFHRSAGSDNKIKFMLLWIKSTTGSRRRYHPDSGMWPVCQSETSGPNYRI